MTDGREIVIRPGQLPTTRREYERSGKHHCGCKCDACAPRVKGCECQRCHPYGKKNRG